MLNKCYIVDIQCVKGVVYSVYYVKLGLYACLERFFIAYNLKVV